MKRLFVVVALLSCLTANFASAQVLTQVFRNMLCANCRTPDDQYAAFVNQFSEAKVEIVYVHTSFPDPGDPFYLASKTDVNFLAGGSFYNVQADPDAFINGYESGTSFAPWRTATQSAASGKLPATLTVSGFYFQDGKIHVNIHVEGSTGGKKVKPYAMLVESGINYNNTDKDGYGNPPNNIWDNVFRAMIPSAQGGSEFVLSGPLDISLPAYDPTGKPWNLANCKIVAYLQETDVQSDNRSYQIDALGVSTDKMAVNTGETSGGTSITAPIPNPSQNFARIPYHLSSPANVRIVICDDLGREVSTLVNGFISEKESSATFIPGQLARGIYYARMFADGAFIGMQKIVFAP
ncbi:MAG: hypothetical protein Q8916_12665 [Bacteroidota bacterium]|nr:hypothetical protein [Bacteroidota bacterium]MDP4231246.1 hypothetical protein [Bacteroidota bacterium]MDP4235367.1 hypothetical protein [Bacteroidota bacterium]